MAAALVLVGLVVMIVRQPDLYRKAPFQHPQVEQARRTFSAAVGPAAVVITSEDLGRPAENIEWWAGVPAVYLTDLERWRISAARASAAYLASGRQPYLLIGDPEPGASELIADLSSDFRVDRVVTIPSSRKMEYFVASPRASSGAVQLYRITPK
jgi:hypothetical protein